MGGAPSISLHTTIHLPPPYQGYYLLVYPTVYPYSLGFTLMYILTVLCAYTDQGLPLVQRLCVFCIKLWEASMHLIWCTWNS